MVLIIDAQTAGTAGNMFIGAFIDLGANPDKIMEIITNYAKEFGEIKVTIEEKIKSGIKTTYANIETADKSARKYNEIIEKIDEITDKKYPNEEIILKSIKLSKKIFKTLAIAESEVHGKPIDEIHFHEVGCADAVADIIGSAYAFHLLELDKSEVLTLPVAVGSGNIKSAHGILPVPAPAVQNILKDTPTVGGDIQSELTTPTGASILVNITDKYITSQPLLYKKQIGYGAGKKDLEVLNALRLIKSDDYVTRDTITILETNIDTLSGEILGNLYETILNEGARDISITPTIMKKNRPGHIIKIISKDKDVDHLVKVLMQETGTLGVRIIPQIHRGVAKREIKSLNVKVNDIDFLVHYKIGYVDEKIIKCSPEYEDVKLVSQKTNIPAKDVEQILEQEYKKYQRMLK